MKLSYNIKKKFTYTLITSLAVIILSYQFSFKKTLLLVKQSNSMHEEKGRSQNLPKKITQLETELSEISGTIELNNKQNINKRNLIIEKTSVFCDKHKLIISELNPPMIRNENAFTIETNIIKTEGSFINLIELLDTLEKEKTIGKIISVKFASYLNRKTKRKNLFSEIYIQNISNHN